MNEEAEKMSKLLRKVQNKIEHSFLTIPAYYALETWYGLRYLLSGHSKLPIEDQQLVEKNVTFIFKSFNRQRKAKHLYHSICSFFPNARIIIADDSAVPLEIPGAEIIHMPFNSGLCKGLIAALEKVETPYMMRLDDDVLLVPQSHIPDLVRFLQKHEEVDLVALPCRKSFQKGVERFLQYDMGKPMIIPKRTEIDGCLVACKTPNWFVGRTEKIRQVGYDPNIRMIDHHEFFFRAAGHIVSVINPNARLLHDHNPFDRDYMKYRGDIRGDSIYIWKKHAGENYR